MAPKQRKTNKSSIGQLSSKSGPETSWLKLAGALALHSGTQVQSLALLRAQVPLGEIPKLSAGSSPRALWVWPQKPKGRNKGSSNLGWKGLCLSSSQSHPRKRGRPRTVNAVICFTSSLTVICICNPPENTYCNNCSKAGHGKKRERD